MRLYALALSVGLVACTSDAEPSGNGGAGDAAGQSGRAGSGAAARGGSTGSSGSGGSTAGAAGGSAPSGGGSGCTMNLTCKLSPAAPSGDPRKDCVDRINQFRIECACLPPLERWSAAESCADRMAMHDGTTGKAHAGFSGRICTPGGNGQNECPSYPSEQTVIGTCLQQMWSEGPPPQTRCEGACFQEHGHFINMTNPQFKRVACGFHRTAAGAVWSVQNFGP